MKKLICIVLTLIMLMGCVSLAAVAIEEDCVHSYLYHETIDVTCTGNGYDLYICEFCGAYEQRNIIQAPGHADNDYDGKCDNCGEAMATTLLKKMLNLLLQFLRYILNIA